MSVIQLAERRRPTTSSTRPLCAHEPRCPAATAVDRTAARVVSSQSIQGWSLLCNGVVLFDDAGEILPGGISVAPPRPGYLIRAAA